MNVCLLWRAFCLIIVIIYPDYQYFEDTIDNKDLDSIQISVCVVGGARLGGGREEREEIHLHLRSYFTA